jgi:hypothetical protein
MYIGHFETKEAAAEARMAKQIELGFTSSHGIRSFTGHNTAARLERALQEAAQ